jgi:hypothetical protein
MKKSFISVGLCFVCFWGAYGQAAVTGSATARSKPLAYVVGERGPNEKTWYEITGVTNQSGEVILHTNKAYVELATGMHYFRDGQWLESKEQIEVLADGRAAALDGPSQAIFPADIYNGVIELIAPDGTHLKSRPLGISYFDGSNSVLIAELTNSIGQILPSGNQVIWTNCFTDFAADLVATYRKGGFECDLVFRERPPAPAEYGLHGDPKKIRLQLLTEFFDTPEPEKIPVASSTGLNDVSLRFGALRMPQGKAFEVKSATVQSQKSSDRKANIPVSKSWEHLDGRTFLIEEVPMEKIGDQLRSLSPPQQAAVTKPASAAPVRKVSARRLLPRLRLAKATVGAIQLARADLNQRAGVVLDYAALEGSATNYTFQGDTTYFISAPFSVDNATFEAGAVIKETVSSGIQVNQSITCLTTPYRPAVFTSMNDNSVGEWIGGSGSPSAADVTIHLALNFTNAVIHDFHIMYSDTAAVTGSGRLDIWDCQFVNVQPAASANDLRLYNVLMDQTEPIAVGSSLHAEHVTAAVNGSSWLTTCGSPSIALTNCLLVAGNLVDSCGTPTLSTNGVFVLPSMSAFQTVGGGQYYLANNSTYRNVGTTNINPDLRKDLAKKTTWPPVIITTDFTTNTSLPLQALRDGDLPDIGYHYDPLDYLWPELAVNGTLTLQPSVSVGFYGNRCLDVYGNFTSKGTASRQNHFVRPVAVQEQAVGDAAFDRFFIGGQGSIFQLRFCDFVTLGETFEIYSEATAVGNFSVTDCSLRGVSLVMSPWQGYGTTNPPGCSVTILNNLFERSSLQIWREEMYVDDPVDTYVYVPIQCMIHNNLLWHGFFYLDLPITKINGDKVFDAWYTVYNNAFDNTEVLITGEGVRAPIEWPTGLIDQYENGYINSSTSTYYDGPNLTNFVYDTGPLGRFYQDSTDFVDQGTSTPKGYYYYTTRTNQVLEGDSRVDIGLHYIATDASGEPIDSDGDGVADYIEGDNGTNPNEYYNGVLPILTIASGNNQSGAPGQVLPYPLRILVTTTNGVVLSNAPLTFTVTQGAAQIALNPTGPFTTSVNLRSAGDGTAAVFAQMPSTLASNVSIAVSASIGTNTVQAVFNENTWQGLRLWLRADAGITNSSVDRWADQSGNHFDGTQSTAANRPAFVSGAINGNPVVRFNGTNDSLDFGNLLNGTTQSEVLVVLKAAVDTPVADRSLWFLGAGNSAGRYPAADGTISEGFGSTIIRNIGNPARPLDQYHLYNVAGAANYWSARINGLVQNQVYANTYTFQTTPHLGYGLATSVYFAGDIAELVIFDHVLSGVERDTVEGYLNLKYTLVAVPAAPANLVANAVSSNQVSLTWNYSLTGSTRFQIERKTGLGGAYALVAEVRDTASYIDTNLVANTQYYYRVKAVNVAGQSGYSNEASVTTTSAGAPLPLTDLRLWLKADGLLARQGTNNLARTWFDQSGYTNDATQPTIASQPLWVDNAINGLPVVRFDGVNDNFPLPNVLNGTTQSEVFIVLKAAADMPVADKSLWFFGAPNSGGRYPAADGTITEGYGSSILRNIGNPTQPLDQYHLFNVAGAANYWSARINGEVQSQAYANTYSVWTTPSLGYGQSLYFAGDMAEVMIFNRVLSSSERETVEGYLSLKYALGSAPMTPTNLVAATVSSNQISLTWNFDLTPTSTRFQVERKTGIGGTYALVTEVRDATSYIDTNLLASTQYYYRVKAVNADGESNYSNEANATTSASGGEMPLGDLRLWLKADSILWNSSGGLVRTWFDQTTNHNDANQTTTASQPQWLDRVLNNRPILRFDGVSDNFTLPNLLSGTTQAEVFVVLKAAVDLPVASHQLWVLGGVSSGNAAYPNSAGNIVEEFGTTSAQTVGNPAQPLDQYHLYNVAGQAGSWAARINGVLQFSASANTYGFWATPRLGFGNNSYFAGDIAEVLIFDKVLSSAERNSVQAYANSKYALQSSVPAAPQSLVATAISPTQINLTWSNVTAGAGIQIERKAGSGGTYALIATLGSGVTNFSDIGLASGQIYFYHVRAANLAGLSAYSNEASAAANNNPTVTLTAPTNGASFTRPTSITLSATASDVDGTVSLVEFFYGSTKIGQDTTAPFSIVWSNPPVGTLSLTAKATDNLGGTNISAAVSITVNNHNPSATLTAPANNSVFQEPANINLAADASDLDGTITKVQFYNGTVLIGEDTTAPYTFSWTNVAGGTYSITAVAIDNDGGTNTSGAITVTVNHAPTATITYPSNNDTFSTPTNITITANASDTDGFVSRVDFYSGLTLLGSASSSPYSFTWNNVSAGTYTLKAIAYDNAGGSGTSPTVQIQVRSNLVAIADAHVRAGNQSANNFGTSTNVEVQTSTANNTRWGYFEFSVPPGLSNISSVKFRFNARLSSSNIVGVTAYKVSSTNWIESGTGGITFNTKPAVGAALASTSVIGANFAWYELDVTSYILSNLAAGSNVISLALTNPASSSETIQINSREATVAANRPVLAFSVTNFFPDVGIVSPPGGSIFSPPANIPLVAQATTPSGSITQVQFFSGSTSIGVVSNAPYSLTWSNVTSGSYNLTARVLDSRGLTATSSVVSVLVDAPPTITLTGPTNGATFISPANITLTANASDPDGSVANVEFFQGGTSLGSDASAPYSVNWNGVAGGSYVLTARATDNFGLVGISSPVNITVFSPPTITVQPQNQITFVGSSAGFGVTATGSGPLGYQWQLNGTNLSGQTSSSISLPNAQQTSSGNYTVVVTNSYGSVTSAPASLILTVIAAWGTNTSGQVTLYPWMTNNIVSISAGGEFSAALRTDGTVNTWGSSVATPPAGISDIIAISSGGAHILAIRADRSLIAWGANDAGQTNIPAGLTNILAISAGSRHNLALRMNGTVAAWGTGNSGSSVETNVPAGLNGVKAVAAGSFNSMVLKSNGTVLVWGANCCGQTNVPALNDVMAIAAGDQYCLALRSNGVVVGWGYGGNGQLSFPGGTFTAVAAGYRHALGLTGSGTVNAWGGQPDPNLPPNFAPPYGGQADVPPGLANVVAIGGGDIHSIALIANNTNFAPNVYITSPTNNSSITNPASITISASATDLSGTIAQVDFYVDGQLIGTDTNSPYSVVWNNPQAGTYSLTAKATDNSGGTKISQPVTVSVIATLGPEADAHVKLSNPTTNFGTTNLLEVQLGSGGTNIAYLRFNLSNAPVATSAKLRLNAKLNGNGSVGTTLFAVANTNWIESGAGGITWSNRPALGSSLTNVTVSGNSSAWYELDITPYVQSELIAGRTLISLALSNTVANNTRLIQINSRENASNPPQLVLGNTNKPPTVSITNPTNNTLYLSPANIEIDATAADPDGTISKVEFFAGATKIGEDLSSPYSFTWQNVSGGTYSITAVATDNNGARRTSAPVIVNVNLAPTVTLTSPTNNAPFLEPATIALSANASDADGSVAKVEYYAGAVKVAESTNSPFSAVWQNAAAGSYVMTARAIDNLGAATVSAGSNITIYPLAIDSSPTRLGYWRFENTNWLGEQGQTPKYFTNIQNIAISPSSHVLLVDAANPANLKYRDVEASRAANIDVRKGSILFRFKPDWKSASAGGSGPGGQGQWISVGQFTTDHSYGCWNISISADGNSVSFITQTNGAGMTNLVAPISLSSNAWYQIALTYSSTNSIFYVNGQQTGTNGAGVSYYPDPLVRAFDGFSIGSDRNGNQQARGQFDELETYNYPLSAANILRPIDSDGDGLPDSWETQYGLDPNNPTGSDGADGDPDGDGVNNLTEYRMGRNPRIAGTVQDTGNVIQLNVYTPFK